MHVARDRQPGVTVKQITKDLGVQTMTSWKWLQLVADRTKPGQSQTEGGELHGARKRIRLLDQEHEILRRACRSESAGKRFYPPVP